MFLIAVDQEVVSLVAFDTFIIKVCMEIQALMYNSLSSLLQLVLVFGVFLVIKTSASQVTDVLAFILHVFQAPKLLF